MEVKLISCTGSFLNAAITEVEALIVYIARVSNPGNQNNMETAPKLIKYLIDNKHWSPFEMVDFTVEIKTSRAIAQQILRHRSFSFQEFSQRYAVATDFEPVQLRKQADKNRQSSTELFDPLIKIAEGVELTASWVIQNQLMHAKDMYRKLIDAGVAKECARMVLPLTTQTTIYMKGSVRSWIHYLMIRDDAHTQLEHQQIAKEIKKIFCDLFPNIADALLWLLE